MKLRINILKNSIIYGFIIIIISIIFVAVADTLRTKGVPRQEFDDIPPYPKSQLLSSNVLTDTSVKIAQKKYIIVYESAAKAGEISVWFRSELPRYGWTLTVPPADNAMPIQELYFEKSGGYLNISLVEDEYGKPTKISLVLRPGKILEDTANR